MPVFNVLVCRCARWYGFEEVVDGGRGVRAGEEEARATCSRELTDPGEEGWCCRDLGWL